ncbi:MAG: energy-coupling factor transporter transmembrane protein EcfT [Sporolactobacillus sp.]
MFNLIIGQYVPMDSYVHRLDPRAKLLGLFAYIIIVFLANNWVTYGMLTLLCAAGVATSKLPLAFIYRGLKPVFLVIVLTFFLNLFFTQGGQPLVSIGWLHITREGLYQSIFISMRIFVIIVSTTLLTLTTSPIAITDGLEALLAPLKKVKIPVHQFALMLSISLRFIPTLLEETEKIIKAQAARGSDFTSGPLRSRIKAVVPLLVPLFVSAFKRAEDLAMAMEARGYHGDEGRTRFHLLKWEGRDTVLLIIILLLTAALVLLRR